MVAEGRVLLAQPPGPRSTEPVAEGCVRLTALGAVGVHQVEVPWSEVEGQATFARLFSAATVVLDETTSA
jgi:hypothetical protein